VRDALLPGLLECFDADLRPLIAARLQSWPPWPGEDDPVALFHAARSCQEAGPVVDHRQGKKRADWLMRLGDPRGEALRLYRDLAALPEAFEIVPRLLAAEVADALGMDGRDLVRRRPRAW
jgi:hypothetical protein